jgi:hypothetical protein
MNSSPMSSTTITTRGRAASLECVDTAFPTRSAIVTRSCLAAVTPEPVLPTIVFAETQKGPTPSLGVGRSADERQQLVGRCDRRSQSGRSGPQLAIVCHQN